MFKITESRIPGCFEIELKEIKDLRGSFTKNYHREMFKKAGIEDELGEEFFIHSLKNVFRGMHFQNPPKAVNKTVFCIMGKVTDYIVDMRIGSPTFGEYVSFDLDGDVPRALFVPKGTAHGYFVKSEFALMQYKSSDVYDPQYDDAINYLSFPFAKEITNPILSDRDIHAQYFKDFNNNFKF